jgi:UDP-N-acetylglucosamine:LPS N-acetylglucosamine transferase
MIAGPGPKVVITGGGGGYPGVVNFYNLALAACANCRKTNPDLSTILVAGPLFKDWSKLRLEGATLFPSHLDMPGLYERAALVICQAGYNTVAEVLRSSKPAICVPAKRAFDDQSERAHLAASRQRAFIVVEKPTVANLSASIVSCLR